MIDLDLPDWPRVAFERSPFADAVLWPVAQSRVRSGVMDMRALRRAPSWSSSSQLTLREGGVAALARRALAHASAGLSARAGQVAQSAR